MGQQINIPGGPQGPGKPGTAIELARAIGAPPAKQLADTPALIAQEREMLVRCEAALENLRFAFWAAGKALQVVRDARLYRATHGTFEEYCLDRWDITPQYAGKLIRAWRVAEKLFEAKGGKSNDLETAVSKKLGFAQAWELVPLAEEHSVEAAEMLYLTLIRIKGAAVTAAMVAGAVAALPAAAAGNKRKTEDAPEGDQKSPSVDPVKTVRALTRAAAKTFDVRALQAAMEHDPDKTRNAARALIEALSTSTGINVLIAPEASAELKAKPEETAEEAASAA
jgi:hypothetical protein